MISNIYAPVDLHGGWNIVAIFSHGKIAFRGKIVCLVFNALLKNEKKKKISVYSICFDSILIWWYSIVVGFYFLFLTLFLILHDMFATVAKEVVQYNSFKLNIIILKDCLVLKSDPHLPKRFVLFAPIKALSNKALFILKIFKFLSWLFGHVEKTI